MAKITGLPDITIAQLEDEVKRGGRFVSYQYCFSVGIMTFKRGTGIHYIAPGKSAVLRGLPFSLLSFLVGWWGIPWGLIWTPWVLGVNFKGGTNVTPEILSHFRQQMGAPPPPGAADEAIWGKQADA